MPTKGGKRWCHSCWARFSRVYTLCSNWNGNRGGCDRRVASQSQINGECKPRALQCFWQRHSDVEVELLKCLSQRGLNYVVDASLRSVADLVVDGALKSLDDEVVEP